MRGVTTRGKRAPRHRRGRLHGPEARPPPPGGGGGPSVPVHAHGADHRRADALPPAAGADRVLRPLRRPGGGDRRARPRPREGRLDLPAVPRAGRRPRAGDAPRRPREPVPRGRGGRAPREADALPLRLPQGELHVHLLRRRLPHPLGSGHGVFHTPTVFVCNNNQWAISRPVSRQTASETLAEKALAYGFEGIRVDGMDALAVFAATRDAVKKARAGGGPTLIEALAYRLGPHSSSDDPSRYRDEKEVEAWRKRDPLVVYRSYLRHLGIWTEEFEAAMEKEIGEEISEAVQKAEAQPPPPVETMFTDVYAEMPPHLEEELQDLTSLRR